MGSIGSVINGCIMSNVINGNLIISITDGWFHLVSMVYGTTSGITDRW